MTQQELDIFLNSVTVVAAVMAAVNSLRHKKRGASAFALAFGFILLAAIAQLYRAHVSDLILEAAVAALFLTLLADFVMRSGQKSTAGSKKR